MWERKWALLAWKLDSSGTVVDEVVVLHDVVGGSTGVYRTIKKGGGEETINIKLNIKHRKKYTANVKLGGTSAVIHVTMKGNTSGTVYRLRSSDKQMDRRGKVPYSIG